MKATQRTAGQQPWYGRIEQRAYRRLGELRRRECPDGSGPLWDGHPPVPVEHVAEHLMRLSITYDEVYEEDGEEILGCLRPETREIVLNERHADRFRENPGTERQTIGHELGHADLFGDVARATEALSFPELAAAYRPATRPARHGAVRVLHASLSPSARAQLRACSPEVRTEVMRRWREHERERETAGQDAPLVRRAVEYYAATLLIPMELLRAEARGMDLSRWSSIAELAGRFIVSKQAMRIALEQLGLIYGVGDDNRILLRDPAEEAQFRLL